MKLTAGWLPDVAYRLPTTHYVWHRLQPSQATIPFFLQAGYPLCMLRQQYRMHPAISAWPSAFFYQGELLALGVSVSPDALLGFILWFCCIFGRIRMPSPPPSFTKASRLGIACWMHA